MYINIVVTTVVTIDFFSKMYHILYTIGKQYVQDDFS